jgi:PIN domain nuclease of toxin-antitoxin system
LILLDTHIWIWWVSEPGKLQSRHYQALHQGGAVGVSVISCWEVAKLVERGRLRLDRPVLQWIGQALAQGVELLDLSPRIVVESTQLPGSFHKDPVDQLLVATARIHDCPLMTEDAKILSYAHVGTF